MVIIRPDDEAPDRFLHGYTENFDSVYLAGTGIQNVEDQEDGENCFIQECMIVENVEGDENVEC